MSSKPKRNSFPHILSEFINESLKEKIAEFYHDILGKIVVIWPLMWLHLLVPSKNLDAEHKIY